MRRPTRDRYLAVTGSPDGPETACAVAPAPHRHEHGSLKMAKTAVRKKSRRWSGRVTRESDALDLRHGVFTWKDPRRIAASLKRSAEASSRRKADPYHSALSMLTFYINRAGDNLGAGQRRVLEQAKEELRRSFGRGPRGRATKRSKQRR